MTIKVYGKGEEEIWDGEERAHKDWVLERQKIGRVEDKTRYQEAEERNLGQKMLLMMFSQEMLQMISNFPYNIFNINSVAHNQNFCANRVLMWGSSKEKWWRAGELMWILQTKK